MGIVGLGRSAATWLVLPAERGSRAGHCRRFTTCLCLCSQEEFEAESVLPLAVMPLNEVCDLFAWACSIQGTVLTI
jgi:hypothetical protein